MLLAVGAARSGTTWLGKILDSHPDVLYRHEPDSIYRTTEVPWFSVPPYEQSDLATARTYLLKLSELRTIKTVGVLPVFPKSFFSHSAFALHRSLVAGFKLAERLPRVGANLKRATFPDFRNARRPKRSPGTLGREDRQPSIVIKSIEALGRVGLFMAACPGLKTILIVRHPCGQVASMLRGIRMAKFQASIPISDDMGIYKLLADTPSARNLGIDLAAFEGMHPIERLAWNWAISNSVAMEALSDCPRGRIVRYEDLCANPLRMSQSLFAFAGLDWNRQTEWFVKASTEFSGREKFYQVFRNPQKSAGKWRSELTREEINLVLRIAQQSLPGRLFAND